MIPGTSRSRLSLFLRSDMERLARDEGGSALVEIAISIMLLMTLIFSVFEVSMAVYSYHFLANAAQEGARYAIVRGGSWIPACDGNGTAGSGYGSSMCKASPADIANYVASRNFPGLHVAAANVCVQYFSSPPATASTTCTANTSPNTPGSTVQVTITYPFTITVPLVPSYNFSMSSTSQMTITQ